MIGGAFTFLITGMSSGGGVIWNIICRMSQISNSKKNMFKKGMWVCWSLLGQELALFVKSIYVDKESTSKLFE